MAISNNPSKMGVSYCDTPRYDRLPIENTSDVVVLRKRCPPSAHPKVILNLICPLRDTIASDVCNALGVAFFCIDLCRQTKPGLQ